MAKAKRSTISLKHKPAMQVTRVGLRHKKLVYVLVTDKKIKYASGRSCVAYIGTTKNGASRIASSAAYRAKTILKLRGVREVTARIVTCRPRKGVKMWRKLERAMLLTFKAMYGEVPHSNSQGRNMKPRDEFRYFRPRRIRRILEDLA